MLNTLEVEAMNYGYRVRIVDNERMEYSAMRFRSDEQGCFRLQLKILDSSCEHISHGEYFKIGDIYITDFLTGDNLFFEYDQDTEEFRAFELLRRKTR